MTERFRKNIDFLKLLCRKNPGLRSKILRGCDNDLIRCLSDCCQNIIKGNVPLNPSQTKALRRHRDTIRTVAKKRVALKDKRQLLLQKGGALPALLIPILSIASTILADIVTK